MPKQIITVPASSTPTKVEISLPDSVTVVQSGGTPIVVTPPPPPPPPPPSSLIAKAGADVTITLPTDYVILDGLQSVGATTFAWSKISGPATFNIDNPSSARCGFSKLVAGTYIFRLTIAGSGLTTTDDVSVIVKTSGVVVPPIDPPAPPPPPPPTTGVKYLQLPKQQSRVYNGQSNLVIENQQFGNKDGGVIGGNSLGFSNCKNITIRNCYFSSSAGAAVYIYDGSVGIKFENCLFAFNRCAVVVSRSSGVSLINCQQINGYGSGAGDGRDGGLLKLIECTGTGFVVEGCRAQNFQGESNPEDLISLYKSSGTSASHIIIKNNIFVGGGPSQSGGGIVAGDGDASFTGGWVDVTGNILLNPGQYGIAIAGGSNSVYTGNRIYSDQFPWSNNPLFIWNQYAPACANNTFRDNYINWTDRDGNKNNGWNAGNCTGTVWETPKTITKAEIQALIPSPFISFLTAAELAQVRAAK